MSVRRAPPCQPRHRDSSRGPCEEQATRGLSRLSLVLTAGRRELATAAMNEDARAEKRKRKEEAIRGAELAEKMKQSLDQLLARLAEVAQEIMMYESGTWHNDQIHADNEREAELLEAAIAAKSLTKEADDAAAAAAAAAKAAEAAQEKQEAENKIREAREARKEELAQKERDKELRRGLGRHPNWIRAENDPENAATYLKSKSDKQWWKSKGYKIAERRELAKARERARVKARRSRRAADDAVLARDAELRARRARYEEIFAIVSDLDDDDEAVRGAAWVAYTQIAPGDMAAFHEENLRLLKEEVLVEAAAEEDAEAKVAAVRRERKRQADAEEAAAVAEEVRLNDMGGIEQREAKREAQLAANAEAKAVAKAEAKAAKAAATEEAKRAAAREKENAQRPPGKRRAT